MSSLWVVLEQHLRKPGTGEKQVTPGGTGLVLMSPSQRCTGPGRQASEVQGQETLGISLSITALVKKEQAQRRRMGCSPPWGLSPGSDSPLSSLPTLFSPPHPNRVLPDPSPDGLSDTLRSELVSQVECLIPSQMAQTLFPSSATGPARDGLPAGTG